MFHVHCVLVGEVGGQGRGETVKQLDQCILCCAGQVRAVGICIG